MAALVNRRARRGCCPLSRFRLHLLFQPVQLPEGDVYRWSIVAEVRIVTFDYVEIWLDG
jgi:hypothetical protein